MSGIVLLILRILIAVTLYAFLGWAVLTIWRDLRAQARAISAPTIPTLLLTPLEENEESETLPFEVAEVIIGRSDASGYAISDETVSARHARLSFHHNQWWVEDMKSTNGTFLNDERVKVPTVMVSGDELRCGQIRMLVGIEDKISR
jgi:pSer/pThr/pTyr-binding forkhead associated (FHA) protein